jgi:phosphate transport system protein
MSAALRRRSPHPELLEGPPIMGMHLLRDLDELQRDLLALAGLVEESIHKAMKSLQTRDVALAREVVAADPQIDLEDNHINEECLKMLALHQPVARDLRRIAAAMMITTDLERMGDLAEEIAERSISLAGSPAFPIPDKLGRMADLATVMVREALDSFVSGNQEQAERVLRMDDEVDRYNDEIIQDLIRTMQSSPAQIEPGLSMFSATRHLERIADHATNIAEDVIYLISGEIVRHRPTE